MNDGLIGKESLGVRAATQEAVTKLEGEVQLVLDEGREPCNLCPVVEGKSELDSSSGKKQVVVRNTAKGEQNQACFLNTA